MPQVFVNAVSAVRRVGALLKLLGLPAVALHAQQQQRQRLKALDRFKSHPHGVLVATDVAARGLDIPNVQVCSWLLHMVICCCVAHHRGVDMEGWSGGNRYGGTWCGLSKYAGACVCGGCGLGRCVALYTRHSYGVLVATDVAARDLDIPNVQVCS
jgi:hypothetical protein